MTDVEMSEIAEVLRMAADDLIVNGRAVGQYQDEVQGNRCLIGAVRYAYGNGVYGWAGEVEDFLREDPIWPWKNTGLTAAGFNDGTESDEDIIKLLLSVADDIDR